MTKQNALKCQCGGDLVKVTDSRPAVIGGAKAIRRRRRLCDKCNKRHTTIELLDSEVVMVSMMLRREAEEEVRRIEAMHVEAKRRLEAMK